MESIKQEVRKFGETTSIKGVGRTIKARSRIVKIFWMISVLACFGLLLFQVITVIRNYVKYTVVANSVTVLNQPNFPDVTVCNLFPISGNIDNFSGVYEDYVKKIEFALSRAPIHYRESIDMWRSLRMNFPFNLNTTLTRNDVNSSVYEELVAACTWYGWDLYVTNSQCKHELFIDRGLKKCQTIRPADVKNVAAIIITVYLNNFFSEPLDGYFNWIRSTHSSGASVMVHPPGTRPDSSNAVYLSPGTGYHLVVRQSNVTRLSSPYGSCSKKYEDNLLLYNRATCISLCRQRQQIETCGCVNAFEHYTEANLDEVNDTICPNLTKYLDRSPEYLKDNVAVEKFWNLWECVWRFRADETLCDCPVRCSSIEYDVTSSATQWPDTRFHLEFYEFYLRSDPRYKERFKAYETIYLNRQNQSGKKTLEQLENLKLIEKNFLQIIVRMNEQSVQLVTEIPAITWDSLLSNLGGSLNLWLGISILTGAEIIELIYTLMTITCSKKHPNAQKTSS